MLADIARGHTDWADVFLLIAAVVAGVEFIVALLPNKFPGTIRLVPLALCLIAVAILLM